uniref:ATP synthase complex subunit 8 n=1 Tax=Sphaerotermes sphaerothorax TaxID=187564 RepID=A0A0A7E8N7_9NEOP|nr:ATP synthase F0 subunit 8 [Sphaerotermes sphaerothorax]AIY61870.1 ATP synthase F0 subunit 8 [Sphaerotermes sphaerothorax]AQP28829.1 ATP synthase F0 subunit 8 [Sphaerotermes sphaerothorax]URH16557.1 ATP synthase F0 subunit 8 [Sphaerotermes sphaerothorax]
MPQMMPMEWTMLYILFLATFLMFNIMNYFTQSPNKQMKAKYTINIKKMNWKW